MLYVGNIYFICLLRNVGNKIEALHIMYLFNNFLNDSTINKNEYKGKIKINFR
jgi:hypothetical protein